MPVTADVFIRSATDTSKTRILLFLAAIGATVVYAGSFLLLPETVRAEIPRIAALVAIAAAISWPIFGACLITADRGKEVNRPLSWATICLRTMVRGNAVLGLSILLNLILAMTDGWTILFAASVHLVILGAANLTMAWFFIRAAAAIGTDTPTALRAWLAGLNMRCPYNRFFRRAPPSLTAPIEYINGTGA